MRTQVLIALLLAACQAVPSSELIGESPSSREIVRAVNATSDESAVVLAEPMTAALLTAALQANAQRQQACAINLTNVRTNGFKRLTATFGPRGSDDGATGLAAPVLLGMRPSFAAGAMEETHRAFDLAIDGDGMFCVLLPDGSQGYTRAGGLRCDSEGKLTTAQGFRILPEITFPTDLLELSVDPEGHVSGRTAGTPDAMTQFGQLQLCRFVAPEMLQYDSRGVLLQTDESGSPILQTPGTGGLGTLKQGFLERSNVDAEREVVTLHALEHERKQLTYLLESPAPRR